MAESHAATSLALAAAACQRHAERCPVCYVHNPGCAVGRQLELNRDRAWRDQVIGLSGRGTR